MKTFRTLLIIGYIEILIGVTTLFVTFSSLAVGMNTKTPSVLVFVIAAAITSTFLGIGVLKLNKSAYLLLLYFSSVVLLSKILIFLDVFHLNGALETNFPSPLKNAVSICYHGFIIYYFLKHDIKNIFHKRT